MSEVSQEVKLYLIMEEKLAEFHYDDIPEEEFAGKWDKYLRKIGVGWTPQYAETGKYVMRDPLYTRGGYLHLEHELVMKILTIGLP